MSSHTHHPDTHTHGLADGCTRCAEHADHPFRTLDSANLRSLLLRIVNDDKPRSENEREAMHNVRKALDHAGALAYVNPDAFCRYVQSRWDVNLVLIR